NLATVLPQWQPAYYFRKTFTVTNTNLEEFLLSATCTLNQDGGQSILMYLNGRYVPATDIGAVSDQGNQVLYFDLAPFINYLQPGTNLVAVRLNNTLGLSWDDVAFDINLKVLPGVAPTSPAQIIAVSRDASSAALTIHAPSNSVWCIQSRDGLADAK